MEEWVGRREGTEDEAFQLSLEGANWADVMEKGRAWQSGGGEKAGGEKRRWEEHAGVMKWTRVLSLCPFSALDTGLY